MPLVLCSICASVVFHDRGSWFCWKQSNEVLHRCFRGNMALVVFAKAICRQPTASVDLHGTKMSAKPCARATYWLYKGRTLQCNRYSWPQCFAVSKCFAVQTTYCTLHILHTERAERTAHCTMHNAHSLPWSHCTLHTTHSVHGPMHALQIACSILDNAHSAPCTFCRFSAHSTPHTARCERTPDTAHWAHRTPHSAHSTLCTHKSTKA